MTRRIAVSAAALVASLAALAAPAIGHAQSLTETFDLIRNAIVSQGSVVWEGFVHDSAPPPGQVTDWRYQRRVDITNFIYDQPNCTFSFHYRVMTDGQVSSELDAGVPLLQARLVKVATEAALVEQRDAQAGHPTWSSRLQPDIYDVDIIRADGNDNVFSFYDAQTAREVAREFEHAASLCGVNTVHNY